MRYFCMLCERDFYDSHSCFNHVLECGGVVKNTKTLRDEFAIAWLQGYMANPVFAEDAEHKDVPHWAYLMADAMMREREGANNHLEERIKTLQEQYANWKDQNEIALDNAEYRIKELEAALNKTAVQRDELRQISRGHSLTCSFIHGATKCDCGFHNMVGRIKP